MCFISRRDVSKTYRAYFFLHVKRALSKINFLVSEVESPLVCLAVIDGCQSCENKKICSANVFFWRWLSMILIVVLSVFYSTWNAEVNVMLRG